MGERMKMLKMFMTGATGLVGQWLIWMMKRDHPAIDITVLSRTPEKNGHLSVDFIKGNIRTFDFPAGHFDYIIHCAVGGTDRMIEMARQNDAAMLYTSSGAVYGKQAKRHELIKETWPVNLDTDYALMKGQGELLCMESGLDVKIARLFAFAGGGQPLDYHYAIGNFIRDGLKGGPIALAGGETIFRSYLHYLEMAQWLLSILFHGKPRHPYNVGSEIPVSIAQLAHDVAAEFGCDVLKLPPLLNQNEWYIPSTERARTELGLVQHLFYPEVMRKMIAEVR